MKHEDGLPLGNLSLVDNKRCAGKAARRTIILEEETQSFVNRLVSLFMGCCSPFFHIRSRHFLNQNGNEHLAKKASSSETAAISKKGLL